MHLRGRDGDGDGDGGSCREIEEGARERGSEGARERQ